MKSILPLVLDAASVVKQGERIIGPITYTLGARGCTVVLGPNGAGKTTLLRLMHGLEKAGSGQVRWPGPKQDAFMRQSFVFQSPVVMCRSVRDNIAYPLTVRGSSLKSARNTAEHWLEKVGLTAFALKDANVLSGGEKQKLAIARALIIRPEVLFLDEPTTNLDGASTFEIEQLISAAQKEGTRIVMATHDMGQARRLANEVLFLYHGEVHEFADCPEFFKSPKTAEAKSYLRGDILI